MLTKPRCSGDVNFKDNVVNTLSIYLKLVILITLQILASECGKLVRVGK